MIASVSQVEKFDHDQKGGCELKWFFEFVQKHKPEPKDSQAEGIAGHALLENYFKTGALPKGRVKMGKAVTAAIAKGELPTPGPDLQVERRFSGQEKFDPNAPLREDGSQPWIPLDLDKTLWLGGVAWEGFIDLRFRRADNPTLIDHKFSSNIHEYAVKADDLIKTVQMPVYCIDSLRQWPDAPAFEIAHHNVAKSGGESFIRRVVVTRDRVLERQEHIEQTVKRMEVTRLSASPLDVPFNRKACTLFGGCPHQTRCHAFKENKVALSAAEAAFFDDVPTPKTETPKPIEAPAPDETPGNLTTVAPVTVLDAPTVEATSVVTLETVPDDEPIAAVLPPDAPASDPSTPAPAKRGRPKKVKAEADAAHPTDGPGWVDIQCEVCGASLGKRPAGHKIDPSLCPNQAVHRAILAPDPVEPAPVEAPAPAPSGMIVRPNTLTPARLARALRAFADALESAE